MSMTKNLQKAKQLLQEADAIFITAGRGIGVDSGLPDCRGTQEFWKAYPKAEELGLCFEESANPRWFKDDPPRPA